MDADAPLDESALLGEALGVDASSLSAIGREPLGDGAVAGFEVDGDPVSYAYVDTSLLRVPAETGLVLEGVARVWMHPADPHLPALAPAAFGDAVAVLLARLGLTTVDAPELIGYRPGRRAVLRVPTADGAAWVKVVRPRRIERIVRAHAALIDAGLPVPAVRGWSPNGLLVIEAAEGTPATDIAWEPHALLDAVDRLRDRLAAAPLEVEARTSLTSRVEWYAERLTVALPAEAARVADLGARINAVDGRGRVQTIHGDLHFGQLFLHPSFADAGGMPEITGLIDVDTAGRGNPADDAAAFIGHAISSVPLTTDAVARARVAALAAAALERWGDDPEVRALTAVHLIGHALGAAESRDVESRARARELLDTAAAVTSGTAAPASASKNPLIVGFEGA